MARSNDLSYDIRIDADISAFIDQFNKVNKDLAEIEKIGDKEVRISLSYDGNFDEYNAVIKKIAHSNPALGVKFEYDMNTQALEKEKKKLEKLDLFNNTLYSKNTAGKLTGDSIRGAIKLLKSEVQEYYTEYDKLAKEYGSKINSKNFNPDSKDFTAYTQKYTELSEARERISAMISQIYKLQGKLNGTGQTSIDNWLSDAFRTLDNELGLAKNTSSELIDAFNYTDNKISFDGLRQKVSGLITFMQEENERLAKEVQSFSSEISKINNAETATKTSSEVKTATNSHKEKAEKTVSEAPNAVDAATATTAITPKEEVIKLKVDTHEFDDSITVAKAKLAELRSKSYAIILRVDNTALAKNLNDTRAAIAKYAQEYFKEKITIDGSEYLGFIRDNVRIIDLANASLGEKTSKKTAGVSNSKNVIVTADTSKFDEAYAKLSKELAAIGEQKTIKIESNAASVAQSLNRINTLYEKIKKNSKAISDNTKAQAKDIASTATAVAKEENNTTKQKATKTATSKSDKPVSIKANSEAFDKVYIEVQDKLNKLAKDKKSIKIKADDANFDAVYTDISSKLDLLIKDEKKIKIKFATDDIDGEIKSVKNALNKLPKDKAVKIKADTVAFNSALDSVHEKLNEQSEKTILLKLETATFNSNINKIKSFLEEIPDKKTIQLSVDGNSATNSSATNEYLNLISGWKDAMAEKASVGGGYFESEHFATYNSKTGRVNGGYHEGNRTSIESARISQLGGQINADTILHTHPAKYAAFSDADLYSAISEYADGVTNQVVVAKDEVMKLNLDALDLSTIKKTTFSSAVSKARKKLHEIPASEFFDSIENLQQIFNDNITETFGKTKDATAIKRILKSKTDNSNYLLKGSAYDALSYYSTIAESVVKDYDKGNGQKLTGKVGNFLESNWRYAQQHALDKNGNSYDDRLQLEVQNAWLKLFSNPRYLKDGYSSAVEVMPISDYVDEIAKAAKSNSPSASVSLDVDNKKAFVDEVRKVLENETFQIEINPVLSKDALNKITEQIENKLGKSSSKNGNSVSTTDISERALYKAQLEAEKENKAYDEYLSLTGKKLNADDGSFVKQLSDYKKEISKAYAEAQKENNAFDEYYSLTGNKPLNGETTYAKQLAEQKRYIKEQEKLAEKERKEAEKQAKQELENSEQYQNLSAINKANKKLGSKLNTNLKPSVKDEITKIQKKIAEINKNPLDLGSAEQKAELESLTKEVTDLLSKTALSSSKAGSQTKLASLQEELSKTLRKYDGMSSDMRERYTDILGNITDAIGKDSNISADQVKQFTIDVKQLNSELKITGQDTTSFLGTVGERLKGINAQFLAQYFSIQDIIRYVQTAAQVVIQLDSALTELRKVSNASDTRLEESFETSTKTAKELGATISDVINVTADWSRLGYSVDDSETMAELTTLFKNVGDNMTADTASSYLISTMQGFEIEAQDAMGILDKYNEVANNFAISTDGIGEALTRSSAAFSAANTDLSEAIALVTTANTVVQDPESVGNAFKVLSARIRGAKNELEDLGEDTEVISTSSLQDYVKGITGVSLLEDDGETFRSIYDILVDIGEVWNDLSDIERAGLAEKLAGKMRSNILLSVLQNVDTLKDAYNTAENSTGSALKEQENWALSIEYSIDKTKASLQELASTALHAEDVKTTVDVFNELVNVLTALIDKFGLLVPLITSVSALMNFKDVSGTKSIKEGFLGSVEGVGELGSYLKEKSRLTKARDEMLSSPARDVAINDDWLDEYDANYVQPYNDSLEELEKNSKNVKMALGALKGIGATLAFEAGAKLIYSFITAESRLQESVRSATATFNEQQTAMDSMTEQISNQIAVLGNSSSTFSEQVEARKQLYDIQSQLVSTYGTEAEKVNLLTTNYEELEEALEKINELKESATTENWAEMLSDINDSGGFLQGIADAIYNYAKTGKVGASNYDRLMEGYKSYKTDGEKITATAPLNATEEQIKAIDAYNKKVSEILDANDISLFNGQMVGNADDVKIALAAIQTEALNLKNTVKDIDFSDLVSSISNAYGDVSNFTSLYNDFFTKSVYEEQIKGQDIEAAIDQYRQLAEEYQNAFASGDAEAMENAQKKIVEFTNSDIYQTFSRDIISYINSLYPQIAAKVNGWQFQIKFSNDADGNKTETDEFKTHAKAFSNTDQLKSAMTSVSNGTASGLTEDQTKAAEYFNSLGQTADVIAEKLNTEGWLDTAVVEDFADEVSGLEGNTDGLVSKFRTLGDEAQKSMLNAVDGCKSVEEVLNKVAEAATDASDSLSSAGWANAVSQMDDGFTKLQGLYKDIADGGDFDFSSISDAASAFKNLGSDVDNAWANLANTVASNPESIAATQSAFNDLTSAYIAAKIGAQSLTAENESLVASYLNQQGVSNGVAVAHKLVANSEAEAYAETVSLKEATDILASTSALCEKAMELEAQGASSDADSYRYYWMEKVKANITLYTSAQIAQLQAEAAMLGSAAQAWLTYYSAKAGAASAATRVAAVKATATEYKSKNKLLTTKGAEELAARNNTSLQLTALDKETRLQASTSLSNGTVVLDQLTGKAERNATVSKATLGDNAVKQYYQDLFVTDDKSLAQLEEEEARLKAPNANLGSIGSNPTGTGTTPSSSSPGSGSSSGSDNTTTFEQTWDERAIEKAQKKYEDYLDTLEDDTKSYSERLAVYQDANRAEYEKTAKTLAEYTQGYANEINGNLDIREYTPQWSEADERYKTDLAEMTSVVTNGDKTFTVQIATKLADGTELTPEQAEEYLKTLSTNSSEDLLKSDTKNILIRYQEGNNPDAFKFEEGKDQVKNWQYMRDIEYGKFREQKDEIDSITEALKDYIKKLKEQQALYEQVVAADYSDVVKMFGEEEAKGFMELVENGSLNIKNWKTELDGLSDEQKEALESLISDYDQLQDILDNVKDTEKEAYETRMTQYEKELEELEAQQELVEGQQDIIESQISLREATGKLVTAGQYQSLIDNADKLANSYRAQLNTLKAQLNVTEENSADYYEVKSKILDVEKSLIDVAEQQAEWNEEIKKIPINLVDQYLERLKAIQSLVENYMSLQTTYGKANTQEEYSEVFKLATDNIEYALKQQEYYKDLLADYDWGSDKYNETASSIESINDDLSSILEQMVEWNKEILEIPINKLNDVNDQLNLVVDAMSDIESEYDQVISAVTDSIDKYKEELEEEQETYEDNVQDRIDAIQDLIDALEREHEARQKLLDVEDAEYDLEEARTQKSIATIKNGALTYEADQESIRENQQALDEAEYNYRIYQLQQQIQQLEDEKEQKDEDYQNEIDNLEDIAEKWSEITENISLAKDQLKATEYLGEGWLDKVLSGNDNDIYTQFKSLYETMDKDLTQYQEQVASNERIATLMEQFVTQYTNGSITYEKALSGINTLVTAINDTGLNVNDTLSSYKELFGENSSSSLTSVLSALQEQANAEANNYSKYLEVYKSNEEVMAKYTTTWEDLKKSVDEQIEALKKAYEAAQAAANSMAYYSGYSSGSGSGGSSGGGTVNINSKYAIAGANYAVDPNTGKVTFFNGNDGGYVSVSGGSSSSSGTNGPGSGTNYSSSSSSGTIYAPSSTVYVRHNGIEQGQIESTTDDRKASIIRAMALRPIKTDEMPMLLKRGEVVLNEAQQSQLVKNMNAIGNVPTAVAMGGTNVVLNMSNLTFNEVNNGQDFANFITKNLSNAVSQAMAR